MLIDTLLFSLSRVSRFSRSRRTTRDGPVQDDDSAERGRTRRSKNRKMTCFYSWHLPIPCFFPQALRQSHKNLADIARHCTGLSQTQSNGAAALNETKQVCFCVLWRGCLHFVLVSFFVVVFHLVGPFLTSLPQHTVCHQCPRQRRVPGGRLRAAAERILARATW